MAQPQRYLFETAFDSSDEASSFTACGKPKPRFSQQDLDTAREEGHQAGFAAGSEAERTNTERQRAEAEGVLAAAVAVICERLTELDGAQAAVFDELAAEAGRLAVTIARKINAELMARQPVTALQATITANLRQIIDEPRVVIRVADPMLDGLAEIVDQIAAECGFAGRLVLLTDDDIQIGDCRIEWADGGAKRDTPALWAEIEAAVSRFFADPAAELPALEERDEINPQGVNDGEQ